MTFNKGDIVCLKSNKAVLAMVMGVFVARDKDGKMQTQVWISNLNMRRPGTLSKVFSMEDAKAELEIVND